MTRNISPVDISAPFFEVARIYRRHRRLLYVGNDGGKALTAFVVTARDMRDGDLVMYEDGKQVRAQHCGYMRMHW